MQKNKTTTKNCRKNSTTGTLNAGFTPENSHETKYGDLEHSPVCQVVQKQQEYYTSVLEKIKKQIQGIAVLLLMNMLIVGVSLFV